MQYAKEYWVSRAMIYDEYFASNPNFFLNRQYLKEDPNIMVISKNNHNILLNEWLNSSEKYSQLSLFAL